MANLIGTAPNQVPTNADLGSAAYINAEQLPVSDPQQSALDNKVTKVVSTDNAIVRFDGTSGAVQNSGAFIDDNGNLGIGTSSLGNKLVLSGSGSVSAQITSSDNGGSNLLITASGSAGEINMVNGLPLLFKTSNVERMRLDASGNLGLGVTPSAWSTFKAFQINGSAISAGSTASSFTLNAYYNGTNWTRLNNSYGAMQYSQDQYYGHSWGIAGSGTGGFTFTQAMTLNASGNLLVGAMGSFTANSRISTYGYDSLSSNSTALTDQKAAMALYGLCGSYNNSLSSNALVLVCNSGLAITPGDILKGYGGNGGSTLAVRIAYNGNILNTNNSYGSLSDEKVKENIVDATPKLSDLLQVKVRNFNLIDDKSKTKQIGVVAQELEEIFPNMIDMQGELKTVKYSVFVPMLIKAIQEQQAIITELKTRIEQLENK